MSNPIAVPAVSVTYAQNGASTKANALGMRSMQERAYQKRDAGCVVNGAQSASAFRAKGAAGVVRRTIRCRCSARPDPRY